VQGVRPAHIVFPKVQVNFLRGILSPRRCRVFFPARLKVERSEDVADGECFRRQVGESKYGSFIFSKQTSPNKSKGRMK
jgi:hypothetical protein